MKLKAFAAFLVALPLLAFAQQSGQETPSITVTGTSTVQAAPDEATVRLGVMKNAKTAREAMEAANTVNNRLTAEILKLGIKREDIQTSRLNLYPTYDNPRPGEPARISGYQASNIISVRISDFAKIGQIVDAGIATGVNNIEGVDFGLRNSTEARSRALKDAVADARSKADAIAEALGVRIVGVLQVTSDPVYVPMVRGMEAKADMAMGGGTNVEPGQLEIRASVTIRYRIG